MSQNENIAKLFYFIPARCIFCKYILHREKNLLAFGELPVVSRPLVRKVIIGEEPMISKLLLVGQLSEETRDIQHNLNRNKLYSVERVDDAKTAVTKMKNGVVHMIMFNMDVFNTDKIKSVNFVRREAYDVPVMMLAKAISKEALDYAQSLTKLIVLEKPFETKEFFGIASKLTSGRDVPQRFHRRFYTKQDARIETLGTANQFEATMLNLSKGGAYLELKNSTDLRGLVKMSIPLGDLNKTYEVNAKVVWNNPQGQWGRGPGVGLQFIQAKDIYRNLLNNL